VILIYKSISTVCRNKKTWCVIPPCW